MSAIVVRCQGFNAPEARKPSRTFKRALFFAEGVPSKAFTNVRVCLKKEAGVIFGA
jgi:hypothetical protein